MESKIIALCVSLGLSASMIGAVMGFRQAAKECVQDYNNKQYERILECDDLLEDHEASDKFLQDMEDAYEYDQLQ